MAGGAVSAGFRGAEDEGLAPGTVERVGFAYPKMFQFNQGTSTCVLRVIGRDWCPLPV